MVLIVLNVLAFILGSLFVEEYNPVPWASRTGSGICQNTCDALWFGNYADNGLQWLNVGSTSILEIVTVFIFSVEYVLRLYTADLENEKYAGFVGRLYWMPTFFSLVDLAATVPFYIDAFFLRHTDLAASQFLRMFRLLRMMRVEGRYDTALTMVDDVVRAQWGLLGTAGFVGVTVWLAVSSLYYLAERRNFDMVYCPACPGLDHDLDAASDCSFDAWGIVSCPGCTGCYNLYQSIPMASYYALLNLFGEFPHFDAHNVGGMIIGTFTAVVAVAVFALPVGIIGNGFEDVIAAKMAEANGAGDDDAIGEIEEEGGMTAGFQADGVTLRGRLYNVLHARTAPGAQAVDHFINILVVSTAIAFMLDTVGSLSGSTHAFLDSFELVSVLVFTVEYGLRLFAAREDPKYSGKGGLLQYMLTFLAVVDLLSFVPYWIEMAFAANGVGTIISRTSDSSNTFSNLVKSLRLLRIFRFERYTHAFTTFDDVFRLHMDVLAITAFTAILFWVFFSACLYFSERNSLDPEMASFYNTIPNSMWVTLLNLSGESPLAAYSFWGKVVTGILGLFATGVFGIPIGVLGAGFEEIVSSENQDNLEELRRDRQSRVMPDGLGSSVERAAYRFVNGLSSIWAKRFELTIYALIMVSVAVGAWQTVAGQENAFHEVEWIAVVVFTIEYLIRLVGVGADPEFAERGAVMSRVHFVASFYSVVDLLAIVPFYVALALPGSVVDEYDEYLRMLRILRLVKLDKYIPSITLIGTYEIAESIDGCLFVSVLLLFLNSDWLTHQMLSRCRNR